MLKFKEIEDACEVCDFVNNTNNIKVVSISPIEKGKAWIDHWVVFYFED